MGGGLVSCCVGRVYGADGAMRVARHHPHRKHDQPSDRSKRTHFRKHNAGLPFTFS